MLAWSFQYEPVATGLNCQGVVQVKKARKTWLALQLRPSDFLAGALPDRPGFLLFDREPCSSLLGFTRCGSRGLQLTGIAQHLTQPLAFHSCGVLHPADPC
jgi:hypothetical protein